MTNAWPGTVPTGVLLDSSYDEGGEDYVALTQPLVGPPLRRRRSSVESDIITFTTIMTFAQFDLLIGFYVTTLTNGTDFFTRPHPRTLSTVTCTFENRPHSGAPIDGANFAVKMTVRVYK